MSFLQELFGPPDVQKLTARRDVAGLIKVLAYQKDGGARGAAAEALGEIGDARAVEPLIAALKDSNAYVRQRAAEALVALYSGGKLDSSSQQRILAQRGTITSKHDDYTPNDCGSHTDSGIGVTF